jgi:CheY-like chemotaxis protein
MLAHELRNPLSPLGTALHLVRTDPERRERFLDMADRQVRQLVRLVDDLLDVSRITQGKITLRREPTLLEEVVARALETVRPMMDTRGHALTVTLPPHPVRLDADPARLAQVFGNLLANAAKYTPAHGSIWLTAESSNGEVAVRVRDTGAGLAPELLPHVFDLFVQGDGSLDRARGGLGIGLTIVRQLVELHGGRVAAWSGGIGKGSEFTIDLPLARPVAEPDARARPAADDHAGRPLRILVVEDNEDTAESLTTILEVWGHEVRVALDGLAALDIAGKWEPEVVLSDLGLPGMDGYALARRLRQIPTLGRTVLIALSGYGRDQDRRQAFDAGFDHHLVKPPDLEGLAALLTRIAAARTPGAGARSVASPNPAG